MAELSQADVLYGGGGEPSPFPANHQPSGQSHASILYGGNDGKAPHSPSHDGGPLSRQEASQKPDKPAPTPAEDKNASQEEAPQAVSEADVTEVLQAAGIGSNELTGEFATLAGELGLDKAGVQKLAELEQKNMAHAWQAISEANITAAVEEFGEDADFSEELALIKDYADDELIDLIKGYHLDNHPAFLRCLRKMVNG